MEVYLILRSPDEPSRSILRDHADDVKWLCFRAATSTRGSMNAPGYHSKPRVQPQEVSNVLRPAEKIERPESRCLPLSVHHDGLVHREVHSWPRTACSIDVWLSETVLILMNATACAIANALENQGSQRTVSGQIKEIRCYGT